MRASRMLGKSAGTTGHGRVLRGVSCQKYTPSHRCRYCIGTEDDALFVCPLTREMVQSGDTFEQHAEEVCKHEEG